MNFGRRTPEAEARRVIDRALEAGIVELDTANLYADGESERIVGRALRGRRAEARITTKAGLWKNEGLDPQRLSSALDGSLERLSTEFVDCFVLHAPDASTPIERTLDGVAQILASGRARSWGVSNFAAWQLVELALLCDARGLARPKQSQVLYNLAVRQLEVEYFACTRRFPVETVVYNPLAGGLFVDVRAATSRLDTNALYRRRYGSEVLKQFAARCGQLAARSGCSLHELALRWVRERPGVDVVLLGPASLAHLEQALALSTGPLPKELLEALDAEHRSLTGTDASYAR
jgi:aryl-alcohol dehydrogenase-like predicted oxidoreductase